VIGKESLEAAHATVAGHEEDAECVVELLSKVCPVHDVGSVVECYVASEFLSSETTNDSFTFIFLQLSSTNLGRTRNIYIPNCSFPRIYH
jgi:hypothetical protein